MIKINLLPHREARRKQKKTAFIALMAASAALGVVVVIAVGGYNASRISIQNQRNKVIKDANVVLDRKIAEIATLKQEIEALKARQQAVEDLQGDRNQPVYLLEELVRQTPQGVYLRSFKQEGQKVQLAGYAQSQERVAELLRNLTSGSPWLEKPNLVEVRSVNLNGKSGKKVGEFTLSVDIKRQRDKDAEAAAAAAAALAKASGATAPGAAVPVAPAGVSATPPVAAPKPPVPAPAKKS
ncbi:MAG: PilN domain-containing protein [Pseudomonadota bacterium]